MSCTENESGNPFLLLFPAVVGCLTLFLARRWASTQVSTTSSTAISRRRKINKDPSAKRPPLATLCKMMAGTKKTAGASKKTSLPAAEEESNGGKRVPRTTRLPSTPPVASDVKLTEGPLHPKHVPFPYIPQDGTLLFEAMTFMFTLVTTGLQFLNLYRTNWWLSPSFSNEAMNYYLIDVHLVTFIVTLISRRFILCVVLELLKVILPPKLIPHGLAGARLLIMGMLFSVLAVCLYSMMLKYSVIKILTLIYPAVIYLVLFGFAAGPLMELNTDPPPLHCCSSEPAQVRAEVDTLRQDFNMRIKKIVFNSVFEAYYSSFIPCCFVQPYIFYDVYAASQQTCFVWGGVFGRYASQLLPAALCDTPHRAAKHLATWHKYTPCEGEEESWCEWSDSRVYCGGARVRAGGALWAAYPAHRHTVAAHPTSKQHRRFYAVFSNPSSLLCFLLCMQLSLILLQICLIMSSLAWNNILSIIILLFINYYTLFKLLRDYLIAFKVYRAESMIQDRNCAMNAN